MQTQEGFRHVCRWQVNSCQPTCDGARSQDDATTPETQIEGQSDARNGGNAKLRRSYRQCSLRIAKRAFKILLLYPLAHRPLDALSCRAVFRRSLPVGSCCARACDPMQQIQADPTHRHPDGAQNSRPFPAFPPPSPTHRSTWPREPRAEQDAPKRHVYILAPGLYALSPLYPDPACLLVPPRRYPASLPRGRPSQVARAPPRGGTRARLPRSCTRPRTLHGLVFRRLNIRGQPVRRLSRPPRVRLGRPNRNGSRSARPVRGQRSRADSCDSRLDLVHPDCSRLHRAARLDLSLRPRSRAVCRVRRPSPLSCAFQRILRIFTSASAASFLSAALTLCVRILPRSRVGLTLSFRRVRRLRLATTAPLAVPPRQAGDHASACAFASGNLRASGRRSKRAVGQGRFALRGPFSPRLSNPTLPSLGLSFAVRNLDFLEQWCVPGTAVHVARR